LPDVFARSLTALALLAVDPVLGGIALRARAGPVRDGFLRHLAPLGASSRLHPGIGDDALFGGLDLSGTLAAGRMVRAQGLLARPGPLMLTMAERCTPNLAARLALVLDQGAGHCVLALDEGAEPDECPPQALAERLAFSIDLTDVALGDETGPEWDGAEIAAARALLLSVATPPEMTVQIVTIAAQLGIDSARAALFTLRAARALAALDGRTTVAEADLATAAALTLAHRATRIPQNEPPPNDPPEEPPPDDDTPPEEPLPDDLVLPDELLLEAVKALLPDDLLARLAARKARVGRGNGTGAARKGNRRGRPLPSRPGMPGNGQRIDIVATLRAAAPWQTIRRAAQPDQAGLLIRPGDIHLRRFEERSDRLLIFAVDASGSAALARLGEAKGAVELLLAQAYARRDHVALIAFRGTGAELLLPPTRSLVQTKRRLAALPGGGGTPLAAALEAAMIQSDQARRRGLTPTVALLTDGRANITLDGRADRPQAAQDAQRLARALRAGGVDALVIDTGNRPEPQLRELALTMAAPYLPLPRADAKRLAASVAAVLND